MTREKFAGGYYDFEKLNMTEGVIQDFKKGSQDRKFFLLLDDGTERLITSPFSLSARAGHRIRFIEHQHIGWVAYRIFETRSYHIDSNRLELTVASHDLPPHGNFIPRYSFWAAVLLFAPLAVIHDTPEWHDDPIALSIQGAYILLLLVLFVSSFFVSFRRKNVTADFVKALQGEIYDALFET